MGVRYTYGNCDHGEGKQWGWTRASSEMLTNCIGEGGWGRYIWVGKADRTERASIMSFSAMASYMGITCAMFVFLLVDIALTAYNPL